MRIPKVILSACLLVPLSLPISAAAAAGTPNPALTQALRLAEAWLESRRSYDDIPGISVAVVRDQDLIWSHALGYADLDSKEPARPDTIYSICSISKLFTSVAVLQQRDAGRLRLDDPVEKYLPWFRIGQTNPGSAPVRVEGLLTHSSGLPRESEFPYWSEPDFRFPTREEIQRRVREQQMLYPSERYFQYSNLGITLAGELVTAVSKQAFEQYVQENILSPLGMTSTTTDIPGAQRGLKLATGYGRRMPGAVRDKVPFYEVRGIAPAAGFASTVEDLARFASWQFRLLEKGGKELLDANTLREMHRVHWIDPDWKTTWGLGFSVQREGNKTFVGHGGSCPGYRSHLLMMPREKVGVIVMTNASGVDTQRLAQRVYAVVAPVLAKAGKEQEPTKAPDAELERYSGMYRGFWGDAFVLPWDDGLAVVSMPTDNPMEGMERFRKDGQHTFRRVREDGPDPGEAVVFEVDSQGRAVRMIRHSNAMQRLP